MVSVLRVRPSIQAVFIVADTLMMPVLALVFMLLVRVM
jgi:hypothetical protein